MPGRSRRNPARRPASGRSCPEPPGATEGVTLHAPKGMAITGDSLWVADSNVLRGFDRSTGRALKEVPVPGATQMNKILPFPNALGVPAGCLVTDTEQWRPEGPDTMRPGTSFLHIIDLDHGEVTTTPNNPWVRPGRVSGGISEPDSNLQSARPFGQVTGAAMTSGGFGLVAWDRPWAYKIESGYDLDKVRPIRLPRGQSYDVVADLLIRAVAVCVFASIGGLAGMLVGWAAERFFKKR